MDYISIVYIINTLFWLFHMCNKPTYIWKEYIRKIDMMIILFVTAILESIINLGQPKFFELDPVTHMTQRKSNPFDPDIRIDPIRLQC